MNFQVGQLRFSINFRPTDRGMAVNFELSGPVGGLDLMASVDYQPQTAYPLLVNIHLESEGQNAEKSAIS